MNNIFTHIFSIVLIMASVIPISQAKTLFQLPLDRKSKPLSETISKRKVNSFNTNWITDNAFSGLTLPADKQKIKEISSWRDKGFALEVWVYPEIANGGYVVLKKGSFGYPKFSANGKVAFYIVDRKNTQWGPLIKKKIFRINKWQHYVFSGGKNFIQTFYNGQLVMSAKRPGIPALNSSPLFIGQSDGWGNNFKGKIGLIRIYKRPLSVKKVAMHYQILSSNKSLPKNNDVIYEIPHLKPKISMSFNGKNSYLESERIKFKAADSINISTLAYIKKIKSSLQYLADIDKVISLYLDAKGYLKAKIKTNAGTFTATSSVPCHLRQWHTLKASWNGKYLQLFIDNKPTGNCIAAKGKINSQDSSFFIGTDSSKKSFFNGNVASVKITNDPFGRGIGLPVTSTVVNHDLDRFKNLRSRHLKGKIEKQKPQVDFEDLTDWKIISHQDIVSGKLYRSAEEPLWGKFVARLDLKKGIYKLPAANKIIIKPAQAINIAKSFDAINIWMFSPMFSRNLRPTLKLSFQVSDVTGKIHNLKMNPKDYAWMHWNGWIIWHKTFPKNIKAPAEMISMTFSDLNEAKKTIYFDSLCFYKRNHEPLKNSNIPDWKDIGVPITPDTILPSLSAGKYRNYIKKQGEKFILGYAGAEQTIKYIFSPETGFLSDITASSEGKIFWPLQNGGWYFKINGKVFSAGDKAIKARLLSAKIINHTVHVNWQYLIAGKAINSKWTLQIKGKTLIIDLKASSDDIHEFRCGKVTGLMNPTIIEVPYLHLGGWRHKSTAPGILNSGKLFVSCFLDWYNSDASELFGTRGVDTKSQFVINLVNGDGSWEAENNNKVNLKNGAIINGGSFYEKKSNNKRNFPHERIFLTVSNSFNETLPNIPHSPNKWLNKTKNSLWATRAWYAKKLPKMDYYDDEYAFWQKLSAYGLKNVNVRFHGNLYRMYAPRRNGDPITFINDTEPQIGGDKALRNFFDNMKKTGFNVGLYTDHTLLAPLSYDAWDEKALTHNSANNWVYGSGTHLQVKNSRMLELQKKYNAIFRKKFNPNCSYLDQITCPPVWRYTDYDTRVPESGMFKAAYKAFVKSLENESDDFSGPVLSEGKMHWMFAGLCDNYAQPQRPDIHLLPNFQLNKLHLLSNDCGYHLSVVFSRSRAVAGVNKLLSYEIAYGNIGHLYGLTYGNPPSKIPDFILKSYFMIAQLQKLYATIPIKEIKYNSKHGLVQIEKAVSQNALKNNQIMLKYKNGLTIFVNANSKQNWDVKLNNRTYKLPPYGYVAELPKQILEYSALINGKRVDFVTGKEYTYCSGNGQNIDFGIIKCSQSYYIKESSNTVLLIPQPFVKAEKILLNLNKICALKNAEKLQLEYKNMAGKTLKSMTLTPDNGKITITIMPQAFKYLLKKQ
jgi:Concanavalin A-like lectin/glucanases superfamily